MRRISTVPCYLKRRKGKHEKQEWEAISQLTTITSPWLTVIHERYRDHRNQLLDYWRVEKADSAVILTLHQDDLVFPQPTYRPGVSKTTLDFPGGRVPSRQQQQQQHDDDDDDDRDVLLTVVVPSILQRELGITDADVERITALNSHDNGWIVNSSFSNQLLFGFVAILRNDVQLDSNVIRYNIHSSDDMDQLLHHDLPCLQCRAVLLEWLRQSKVK